MRSDIILIFPVVVCLVGYCGAQENQTNISPTQSIAPLLVNITDEPASSTVNTSTTVTQVTIKTTQYTATTPHPNLPITLSTTTVENLIIGNIKNYSVNIIIAELEVPKDDAVTDDWQTVMEQRLLEVVKKAWITSNGRRKKRLTKAGGFRLQVAVAYRDTIQTNKVSLLYVVEWFNQLIDAVTVESKIASLNTHDVVLLLQYPVIQAARAYEGSQLTTTTRRPSQSPTTSQTTSTTEQFSQLERDLIISFSVVGGLVVLGLLFWMICCCIVSMSKKREAEQQLFSYSNQQPINSSLTTPYKAQLHPTHRQVVTTPAYPPHTIVSDRKLPLTPRTERRESESPDDGYSETSDAQLGSIYGHSETSSSRRVGRPRRRNRISPSLSAQSHTLPLTPRNDLPTLTQRNDVYSTVRKLPPINHDRKYLVSSPQTSSGFYDRGDIEYYRNKQIQRSLRQARKQELNSMRNSMEDELDPRSLTDSREKMHELFEEFLSYTAYKRTLKRDDSEEKTKKKKKKDNSSSSSSSSNSSSSSSSEFSSGEEKKEKKKNNKKGKRDKDEKKDKKKKKIRKNKVGDSNTSLKDSLEKTHEPLQLDKIDDHYSEFMSSPYTAADETAKLNPQNFLEENEKPLAASWDLSAPDAQGRTIPKSPRPGSVDWSQRKTLHIPQPKYGTGEVQRLAKLNSHALAQSDDYSGIVLSTAMFRSASPSMDDSHV